MTKHTPKKAMIHDNPFTVDYHRRGAAASLAVNSDKQRMVVDADGHEEVIKDGNHPINSNRSMLLGLGASGCDWNDHVLLPDAKGVDITAKEIIFAFKAQDEDKEVYIKSMVAMVRNIIFNIDISYTLTYKGDTEFEAVIDTFTATNALNSQGKYIALTLSDIAKKDIIMAVLDLSADQVKRIAYASSNLKAPIHPVVESDVDSDVDFDVDSLDEKSELVLG